MVNRLKIKQHTIIQIRQGVQQHMLFVRLPVHQDNKMIPPGGMSVKVLVRVHFEKDLLGNNFLVEVVEFTPSLVKQSFLSSVLKLTVFTIFLPDILAVDFFLSSFPE